MTLDDRVGFVTSKDGVGSCVLGAGRRQVEWPSVIRLSRASGGLLENQLYATDAW